MKTWILLLLFSPAHHLPFLSSSSPHLHTIVLAILISIIGFVGLQLKGLPPHHCFSLSDAGGRFRIESHLLGAYGDA